MILSLRPTRIGGIKAADYREEGFTDELLKKRITYEKMLAGISEQAVMVENLDHFLDSSLKSMGSILNVSRVFIFEYQFSSNMFFVFVNGMQRVQPN